MRYNNKVDAIQDKLAGLESQYIGLAVADLDEKSLQIFNSVTRKLDVYDPNELAQLDWYSWKGNDLCNISPDKLPKLIKILCSDKSITYKVYDLVSKKIEEQKPSRNEDESEL